MRYYCTYFDNNYLTRALALLESMQVHEQEPYTVLAVCLDELSRVAIDRLGLPNVVTVPLHEIEAGDAELLVAKQNRTLVEYYWTLTPSIILKLLQRYPEAEWLTYLDADLFFFSSPSPIFQELASGSVLIHEHRFSPDLAYLEKGSGRFNVGLLVFRNNEVARAVLQWWRARCIEWCYARSQDGKMGDQMYLNEWPTQFDGVVILQHLGGGLAPWNHGGYQITQGEKGEVLVNRQALIFYHAHSLVMFNPDLVMPAKFIAYPLPEEVIRLCYVPYILALRSAIQRVQSLVPNFAGGFLGNQLPGDAYTFLAARQLRESLLARYPAHTLLALDEQWDCFSSPQFRRAQSQANLELSEPRPQSFALQPSEPNGGDKSREPFLVSAIVSTYNSEKFIRGCLEDLIGQTLFQRGQLEIVVVDSASQQNERAVVEEFQKRFPNIVYIRTEQRETLYAAWNRAIRAARGKYMTNANTDDRHRSDALERLSAALENHPEIALAYADCFLSLIPNESYAANSCDRLYRYPEYFAPAALVHYQFGPQPMWRKQIHQVLGYFNGELKAAGDYEFNLRFAQHYRALHLPIPLGTYLAHPDAISFANDGMKRENAQLARLYQRSETLEALYGQAEIALPTEKDRARAHLDLGLRALEYYPPWKEGKAESNPDLAAWCFRRAMELDPAEPAAANNLACLLAWTGQQAKALELLRAHPARASHAVLRANIEQLNACKNPAGFANTLELIRSDMPLPTQQELSFPPQEGAASCAVSSPAARSTEQPMTLCLVASTGEVNPRGPSGGLEMAMVSTARALARRGHRVALVAPRLKQAGCFDNVEYLPFADWAAGRYPEFRERADALGFASGPDLGSCQMVSDQVARVALFHHQEIRFQGGADPRQLLNDLADEVICVSYAVKTNLEAQGIRSDKLTVVPNGVDQELFHPYNDTRDWSRILYVGALVPDKNPHTLIAAFLTISPQFPKAELHICGSARLWGMVEYLDPVAIQRQNPKIFFHGIVSQPELARQYAKSGLCVIPSKFESFSLTSIEAQACGCVPLVARTGGLPETIQPGRTGFVYEPNEVSVLAETLVQHLKDPEKLRKASPLAMEFVRQNFSWDKVAQEYEVVFRRAVGVRRQRLISNAKGESAGASGGQAAVKSVPLVSVVIPCYKQAHFLADAVESVVGQTFQNWEILIVDDGSPDNTSALAKRLISKHSDKRIRLIEKPNGGLPSARNAGIRAAGGHYILPLDADDRIRPTLLEKLVPILDTHPTVGFAYPHIQHFGACETEFPLPDFDRATLVAKDNIACVCALFRKSVWEQVGGYNETMREGYEDWDFWVGCVEKGWDGYCLHEPLFLYRKSGQSMLSRANSKRERLFARIVCNHASLYDEPTRQWARNILEPHQVGSAAAAEASSPNRTVAAATQRPLRITYLISSILGVTGGNQTLLRQAEEMRRRGHEVTIVTYTPKPDWFRFQTRVIQVPSGQRMAPFVPQSDVVVATYFSNAPELSDIKAPVKVYYAQGDQFVFEDKTLPDTPENRRRRELSRASYLLPGIHFVPNSRNLAQVVEKLCGRRPDGILPVCTDQEVFRPLQRPLSGSRFRLLIVGPDARGSAVEPLLFKGIQDIHDALRILAQRCPHFTAIRMSGTSPDIFAHFPCEFYVAPSDEVKTMLFGTSHILIYASHYDSCPRPPQEAMAAGCAVVCTATGGALEYCRDGENALLVPIQSPAAIADAVERLMKDSVLREKLVQGGLATAREYPREREWNEWEALLYRFVDEAAHKAGTPATGKVPVPRPAPVAKPANSAPLALPACAKVGSLDEARVLLGRQEFAAAWKSAVCSLQARPFHPEAWLLLAEIARVQGDSASARRCAQQAHNLAPDWKAPSQFLQKKLKGNKRPDWLLMPAGMANRLTVCLITKNEEKFLGQCLASVRGLADQIVVVDTGSTDRTVAIAKEHGVEVYSFTWCDDFSAARNIALEHARGDWVLILDADEELPSDQHARLRTDLNDSKVLAYRMPIVNKGQEAEGQGYVPRLFRNAPGVYFRGRVHEQVFPSLIPLSKAWGLKSAFGAARLLHHGYSPEIVQERNKVERNLKLLRQVVEEYPEDPNLVMNLGLELVRSGDLQAGLARYREAFELISRQSQAEVPPELREVLLTQFASQLRKARALDEVVQVLTSPLAKNCDLTASLHFALGLSQYELGHYAEAAEQMRQCLAKLDRTTLSSINPEIRTAVPYHCLALSLAKLGDVAGAEQAFQAGWTKQERVGELKLDYAKFLVDQKRPVDALHRLHELVGENAQNAIAWQLGGHVALSEPQFLEFACDWTGEAIKYLPEDNIVIAQRAEALLLSQDPSSARELWDRLVNRQREPRALAGLILCDLLEGAVAHLPQGEWESVATSRAFIEWYRKCLSVRAKETVLKLNARTEELRRALPEAARILEAAFAEAERPEIAECSPA